MPRGKLRVRCLTLAPLSDLGVDRDDEASKEEDDHAQWRLDREKLSRAIELSMAGGHRSTNRHIVEPVFSSKFWARSIWDGSSYELDDEGKSESEDDISTPTLFLEAHQAGFSLEQVLQVETELN
jgi:hypothetical protein